MRVRCTALAALALTCLAFTLPARAASGLTFTDAAGDANGLNTQAAPTLIGQKDPHMSVPTGPASRGAADIKSVQFESVKVKRVVTAWRITIKLGAKPDVGIAYRVLTSPGGCYIWPTHFVDTTGSRSTSIRTNCNGTAEEITLKTARETADGLVIEVPLRALKALKPGVLLRDLAATTRFTVNAGLAVVTAPQYDYTVTDKTWKIGS